MPERVRAVIKQVITQELKDPTSPMRAEIIAVARDAVPEFFQSMLDDKAGKGKTGERSRHRQETIAEGGGIVKTVRLRGHKNVIIKSLPGAKRRWKRGNPTPADYATNPWKYDVVVCALCGPDTGKTHLTKCPKRIGAVITRTWRPKGTTA